MSLSRSSKTDPGPRVDINIVPLVDVSLVLLIIFMVTATFIKSTGMHIQLPSSTATRPGGEVKRELVIGIDANGAFLWGGGPVTDGQLGTVLRKDAQSHGTESRITVQGDERAPHGRVVRAMTLAQETGFSHLVIAARKEEVEHERRR